MRSLVLASSSSYRKALLDRLRLPYLSESPDIDETPLANEEAQALVQRLAISKAQALAKKYTNHLIIGSDQVAVLDGHIVGKPLCFDNAFAQLKAASGKAVYFYTGLAVIDSQNLMTKISLVPFTTYFRQLSDTEITSYLHAESPYDCAGSFKAEGLGISLFEKMEGSDATSLIGLPLIELCRLLRLFSVTIP
ncbi:Maf family nucleotide pyrophosphatase [Pseudomonas sp. F1_0610]|uniref:Maf family protein n=1 Tax=Pseudomonas sp. F1_0610 TaxID=3114284 RepID=UPI0039C0D203